MRGKNKREEKRGEVRKKTVAKREGKGSVGGRGEKVTREGDSGQVM